MQEVLLGAPCRFINQVEPYVRNHGAQAGTVALAVAVVRVVCGPFAALAVVVVGSGVLLRYRGTIVWLMESDSSVVRAVRAAAVPIASGGGSPVSLVLGVWSMLVVLIGDWREDCRATALEASVDRLEKVNTRNGAIIDGCQSTFREIGMQIGPIVGEVSDESVPGPDATVAHVLAYGNRQARAVCTYAKNPKVTDGVRALQELETAMLDMCREMSRERLEFDRWPPLLDRGEELLQIDAAHQARKAALLSRFEDIISRMEARSCAFGGQAGLFQQLVEVR